VWFALLLSFKTREGNKLLLQTPVKRVSLFYDVRAQELKMIPRNSMNHPRNAAQNQEPVFGCDILDALGHLWFGNKNNDVLWAFLAYHSPQLPHIPFHIVQMLYCDWVVINVKYFALIIDKKDKIELLAYCGGSDE
jgi:hypothetical protein